jgi:hypothetical protein
MTKGVAVGYHWLAPHTDATSFGFTVRLVTVSVVDGDTRDGEGGVVADAEGLDRRVEDDQVLPV